MTGVCVTCRIVSGILGRDFRFVGVMPDGGCPARLEDPRFTHTEDLVVPSISTDVIGGVWKRTKLVIRHSNVMQRHITRVLDGVFPCDRAANAKMGTCPRVRILAVRRLLDVNPELPNRHVLVAVGCAAAGVGDYHVEAGGTRTSRCPGNLFGAGSSGDRSIGNRPGIGGSNTCVCHRSSVAYASRRDTARCCDRAI